MMKLAHRAVKQRVVPLLKELIERAAEHRGDGARFDAGPGKRVTSLIHRISQALEARYTQKKLETIGTRIARAVSDHQKRQLARQATAALGTPLGNTGRVAARAHQFVAENVALIRSIPRTYFAEVEARVLSGIRNAERSTVVAEDLEERYEVSLSRARLIARDQVSKFNGELNEARQQALGVEKYIWRTVQDNRVRSEHADREGEIYSWDDPPGDDPEDPGTGGHPGVAINCRCWAEPIFEAPEEEADTE